MKFINHFSIRSVFRAGKTFILLVFLTFSMVTMAQLPGGFKYQAVARNSDGSLMSNANVTLIIGLHSGTTDGPLVWEETHQTQTNEFGLFNIVIGDTLATRNGGSAALFSDINWSAWPYFLNVNINGQDMGTVQLLSVPFALNAQSVSSLKKLDIKADENFNPDSALFIVRNSTGQPVFAVYPTGVRVYVDTSHTKRSKGGFAIGGFGPTKGTSNEYMRVTPDSVRIYLDMNAAKRSKGGFAIGGFNSGKGLGQELLKVTEDSTRIYISNTPAKRSKGGFAIGGFNSGKGSVVDFLNLTSNNYFIGHESGINNTIGLFNNFLGYQAGRSNTEGTYNTFIGFQSGFSNTGYDLGISVLLHGSNNTFVGYQTGYSNTMGDYNTILGSGAGFSNTEGRQNTFIGYNSGEKNVLGVFNVFLGANSGAKNTDGRDNVFCGSQTGMGNTTGELNTYLGNGAGKSIATGSRNTIIGNGASRGFMAFGDDGTGSNNVYLGYEAGHDNKNGSNNVFIGYQAGYAETGSDQLYIDNTSTADPLIWGDFQARASKISGNLEVTGTIISPSDLRMKKNIQNYANVLDKIIKVQPVTYLWKREQFPVFQKSTGKQIGVIAQDLKKIFPELVEKDSKGFFSVNYVKMPVILIAAIKEQQKLIEKQQTVIQALETKIEKIELNQSELADLKEQIKTLQESIGLLGEK